MKRLFTLITSIVLATSLLAVPCFAAEPEDLPTPQTGVTETEQPEDPDESGMQLYDAFPGGGEALQVSNSMPRYSFASFLVISNPSWYSMTWHR